MRTNTHDQELEGLSCLIKIQECHDEYNFKSAKYFKQLLQNPVHSQSFRYRQYRHVKGLIVGYPGADVFTPDNDASISIHRRDIYSQRQVI